MNTKQDPRELAIALMNRSRCSVQVACVIADAHGVFAWGWNSAGPDGYGQCAERHALSRANKERLAESTVYIVGRRRKSGSLVNAYPCAKCWPHLYKVKNVEYNYRGKWQTASAYWKFVCDTSAKVQKWPEWKRS